MSFRFLSMTLGALALAFSATTASAQLGNEELVKYYKKKAQLAPTVVVEVTNVSESPLGGEQGLLTIGSGARKSKVAFLRSADGRYVVFGDVEDITVNPAAKVMAKINLEDLEWKGPDDAPVTIIEYSDFQCPFCAKGYKIIEEEVLPAYEGKVRFTYKHLPLGFHKWAEPASVAMECARRQDPAAAWRIYDEMFAQQRAVNEANVKEKSIEFAGEGIDAEKFNTCYDNNETLELVRAQTAEARSLGITGTPSFVVNGQIVKGAQPAAKFKAIIDGELADLASAK